MASKIAFCGYIGHPYKEPLKEEKHVDHWAKKDNDEVLAAGIINFIPFTRAGQADHMG
ncbi:hypothetical protein [Brevibacillus laterosporus]|uniref:hypothetical protein n=1 Tax=Brevibacillus laterosporus TaxID=1465 RepID=UPI0013CEB94A|nr:hypothetical protein [Brevibacillus laterosporus]